MSSEAQKPQSSTQNTDPDSRYDCLNSPFVELQAPFTLWEAVKMLLLLPTVPLRIALAAGAIIAVAVVNSILIFGCNLDQPLAPWRRRCIEVASSSASRAVLLAMGFWRPRLVGYENFQRGRELGAVIGIFNHVSYLDAFVVVWACCTAGVTFHFSQHLPVLGYGVRALQNLYLPPPGADKRANQASMVQLIKERAHARGMPMLSVAPEGTLSHGRCLLKFKSGTFVAGVPVVPILLRYKLTPHNPAWTLIIPAWHALRLMCQWENAVTVEMLPPYIPSEAEKADPTLYASNVRSLMASKLGVPLVEQDRSHWLALCAARISVSWDGRRVLAPPGVLDEQGVADLSPFMPGGSSSLRAQPKKQL